MNADNNYDNNNEEVGISLGWRCQAAIFATQMNMRKKKIDGYKTCPFDLIGSNYIGMCKCIEDDFKYFCDPKYLVLKQEPQHVGKYFKNQTTNQLWIYNTYYNFFFNHESPGHANLYLSENWSGGITHFIDNNFEKFIERYTARINNFREYFQNYKNINISIMRYNAIPYEILEILERKYPNTNFMIYNIINLPDERQITLHRTYDEIAQFEKGDLTYMNIRDNDYPGEHNRYTNALVDCSSFEHDKIKILSFT